MAIRVTLDAVLARRGMTGKELARRIGISETQLSLFRSGKVRGIRFATLDRLCEALACRPGDLLDHGPIVHVGQDISVEEERVDDEA